MAARSRAQLLLELAIILFPLISVQGQEVTLSPSPSVTCEAGQTLKFNCSHREDFTALLSDEDQNITSISPVQWFINNVTVPASPPNGVKVNGSRLAFTCPNQTSAHVLLHCQAGDIRSNVTMIDIVEPSGPSYLEVKITVPVVAGAIFVAAVVAASVYVAWKRKDINLRKTQRTKQESKEKDQATKAVKKYLEGNKEYSFTTKLGYLGGRLKRHWFEVSSTTLGRPLLLTIAPLPKNCSLLLNSVTIQTLDKLLTAIAEKAHPFVHIVHKIDYNKKTDSNVVIIQDKYLCGSLRDELHDGKRVTKWSEYTGKMNPLSPPSLVACYGKQILQGLLFFYKQGFPPLGHVHIGNIYIEETEERGRVCKVGGYENTLLGYRSQLYRELYESGMNMDMIDVVMFGHVIYTMATGREFSSSNGECQDSAVKEVLAAIFESAKSSSTPKKVVKKIMKHRFFEGASQEGTKDLPFLKWTKANDPGDFVRGLLEKVRSGEPVQQEEQRAKDEPDKVVVQQP